MGGDIITQSTEEKDLGITIDEKLKFQIHINNQTKKANQRLGMIKEALHTWAIICLPHFIKV
jgi:hypothetical protein